MKGRQKGRPTKWVAATVQETISIGKPGVLFEVWEKRRKTRKKLGTLTVSVGACVGDPIGLQAAAKEAETRWRNGSRSCDSQ